VKQLEIGSVREGAWSHAPAPRWNARSARVFDGESRRHCVWVVNLIGSFVRQPPGPAALSPFVKGGLTKESETRQGGAA
jgi:hypothetical protein